MSFVGVPGETAQFQYIGGGVWQVSSSVPTVAIPPATTTVPTNGFPTSTVASLIMNPLRYNVTLNGLQTFASILAVTKHGNLQLNASALSSGVVPQSLLPGFQGTYDSIGGGSNNVANGGFATVPGGLNNTASGEYGFAAGYNAQATNSGAFVWSDGTGTQTTSITNNSVTMRASGGYRFFSGTNQTAGAELKPNATAWSTLSDRNAKKNFATVNCEAILDKLAQIPLEQWNYKWENDSNTPNIGPMAQDFKAAFYPGRDNCTISTLEFDGVELAAIQGLNQKVEARSQKVEARSQEMEVRSKKLEAENAELAGKVESGKQKAESRMEKLEAENAELRARLERLEHMMSEKSGGGE